MTHEHRQIDVLAAQIAMGCAFGTMACFQNDVDDFTERFDPQAAYKRTHLSPQEHKQHDNHVRHMIDLERQLGFFTAAGFEGVDVYWKQLDYVVYGGRRPK